MFHVRFFLGGGRTYHFFCWGTHFSEHRPEVFPPGRPKARKSAKTLMMCIFFLTRKKVGFFLPNKDFSTTTNAPQRNFCSMFSGQSSNVGNGLSTPKREVFFFAGQKVSGLQKKRP